MFTGIVEELGKVERITPTAGKGIRLAIRSRVCGRGAGLGESIAVNGCCLTVVRRRRSASASILDFDLLQETWRDDELCDDDREWIKKKNANRT